MNEDFTLVDGIPHIEKRAGDKLDYTFDMTDYMLGIDATMGEYSVRHEGSIIVPPTEISKDGEAVTVLIDGGVRGYSCAVHLDFALSGTPGRHATKTIVIDVV